MCYKVHNEINYNVQIQFLRESYIKTAEIVKTSFATWHSTKNEDIPCSQCTKMKDIVRQTHEDIF